MGIEPWNMPRDGMFLWARLPDGLDAGTVARKALAHDVVLAPGNVFSQSQSWPDFLRFNVSHCDAGKVFDVLDRAMSTAATGDAR